MEPTSKPTNGRMPLPTAPLAWLLVCALSMPADAVAKPPCDIACDAGGCIVNELLNVPLGSVTVSITDKCELEVDDIETVDPPVDGAAQVNLSSLYMQTVLGTPNLSGSIAGTLVQITQFGVVNGDSGQEIMLSRLANFDDDTIAHSINCDSVRATSYEAHVYDGDELVVSQNLGVSPPVLRYPKVDVEDMACGILPNADLYTVFKLSSPQPVTFATATPPVDPGPFVGDIVYVVALAPVDIATSQESIENLFSQTGPVRVRSVYAGGLPGAGAPCAGSCAADLSEGDKRARKFMKKAARTLAKCSMRGRPLCPAPCRRFPSVDESGLTASCYDRLACYVDESVNTAAATTWGEGRCPVAEADTCDLVVQRAVRTLIQRVFARHRKLDESRIPDDVERCTSKIARKAPAGCSAAACADVPGWVEEVVGE